MGNCFATSRSNEESQFEHSSEDQKILRIVRVDGKVLEYRASVLVRDLLLNFDGYGVGASRRASRHLPPNHELRIGMVYYLLPLLDPPRVTSVAEKGGGGKKIKIVVTKQQLQELLLKKISVEEVISRIQRKEQESIGCAASWRPQLESILEGSVQD